MGQAFRLGRYAIHFHLNGDMEGSYVRSVALRNTFNRAVNIHNTHNLMIERNVAYRIMGGAFFLEDGVETGEWCMYEHWMVWRQVWCIYEHWRMVGRHVSGACINTGGWWGGM